MEFCRATPQSATWLAAVLGGIPRSWWLLLGFLLVLLGDFLDPVGFLLDSLLGPVRLLLRILPRPVGFLLGLLLGPLEFLLGFLSGRCRLLWWATNSCTLLPRQARRCTAYLDERGEGMSSDAASKSFH